MRVRGRLRSGVIIAGALLVGALARPAAALPCGTTELTQSSSQAVVAGNSVACVDSITLFNFETSYYRAFDLPALGITGDFHVCAVELGIESAVGGGGSQPLTVKLYRNSGPPFPGGSLTVLGSAGVVVADQTLTMVSVPVAATVAKGGQLVVEILVPDGMAAHNLFFIGSNPAAESGPSYVRAPACGVATPVPMADPAWGFPGMHIVLNVDGDVLAMPVPTLDRLGLLGCVLLLLAVAVVGIRRREKEASMMNRMGGTVGRGAGRTKGRLSLLACALGVAAGAMLWAGAAQAVPVVCNAAGVAALGTCNSNYATCTTSLNTCTGSLATCTSSLATCNAGTATAADVLSGKTFSSSSGLGLTGSVPAGSDVSGANGLKTFAIPDGLYSGSKSATANDSNLAAGNIVTGVSIFGVAGNVVPSSQTCGNNLSEGSEVCDGTDLNGQTCAIQAPATPYGTLACNGTCSGFVTTGCVARFVDNGDGTITDNQTKLIWEKKDTTSDIHNVNNKYSWSDASFLTTNIMDGTVATTFLATLNGTINGTSGACFAGQCDWRIPSLLELQTILLAPYPCVARPCIDPVFGPTQLFLYWSATSFSPANAYFVSFIDGFVDNIGKPADFYVRAVRSGL